jgi:hypothetical protein
MCHRLSANSFWPTMGNSVPTTYLHSPVSVTVGRQAQRLQSCVYNIQYICRPHCEDSVQGINKMNCFAATPRPIRTNRSVARHSANVSWTILRRLIIWMLQLRPQSAYSLMTPNRSTITLLLLIQGLSGVLVKRYQWCVCVCVCVCVWKLLKWC